MATYRVLRILPALAVFCLFGITQAHAVPISNGSMYSITLLDSSAFVNRIVTFDGSVETSNGISVQESQSSLGGGLFSIDITLSAVTDLFPGSANPNNLVSIGRTAALDFVGTFDYVSGIMKVLNSAGAVFQQDSLACFSASCSPWDGTSPNPATGWIVSDSQPAQSIAFSFIVERVPEPPTLALFCIAGIGFAANRRRKSAIVEHQ